MRKSKVERVFECTARRVGSHMPCTIELGDLDGDPVITTVDLSRKPKATFVGRMSHEEATKLYKAIGDFLDPINGAPQK